MSNILDAVLAQYENNKVSSNTNSNKMSQDERLKKYFTTILPKGEREGQKRVRILPTTDGTSPFKEVWFHEVQVGGRWMKLYDPGKNDGERSPLNEVYEGLMATGDEQDKVLARQYRSRKFYIVKVIDQDKPEDGVKFWRFKHNYKGDGILDKIIPIWKNKGDVTDAQNGRDLILSLSIIKAPNGKEYTNVASIMYDDPMPLSANAEEMQEWLSDEMTWSDVYSKKPEEYLEAIAQGFEPRWDSDLGKYVYNDGEQTMQLGGIPSTATSVAPEQPKVDITDNQTNATVDEDLPF
jgi:hypothetical protein